MKKYIICSLLLAAATIANAVPARRGWRTVTQPDGTTIEVQKMGDEYYHYLINREGQELRLNADGRYEVVGEASEAGQVSLRRAKASANRPRRAKKDFGITPNLAPKGVVILVNFNDKKMRNSHTLAVFEELCNSANCSVNEGYPSAAEYFNSQSNGAYRPVFDVFGPVTLSKSYSYYGNNVGDEGEDEFAADAVIEACILANQNYSDLNFADYDSDKDGKVDFVYVIYAGYGEADSDDAKTIWPHNWSIQDLVYRDMYYPSSTKYKKAQTQLDGVYLDNYAMSNELDGYTSGLTGIGTLCHEFGHVMGLPDWYDTNYGYNYDNALTPNDWDVMDGGAYNGDGHCPPNYSAWEKYFFGWHTPVNLGSEGQVLTLEANGTEGYQAYQINASGKQQTSTTEGECYYIENRQQQGWDKGLPHHGLLIWKVNYNQSKWVNNEPNNTDRKPLYTIVSASGTGIGTYRNEQGTSYIYDGPKNVFPGSAKVTSWEGLTGKPLKEIKESNGVISLVYIDAPAGNTVQWVVNGEVIESKTYEDGAALQLPSAAVQPCDGKAVFLGWTTEAEWLDPFNVPADLFTSAEGKTVTGAITYYAVFE